MEAEWGLLKGIAKTFTVSLCSTDEQVSFFMFTLCGISYNSL